MKLTFEQKDFDELRKFQNKVYKQLGEQHYVGTDSMTLVVEFSKELKACIRPLCHNFPSDFEFRVLTCEGCKRPQPFLCSGLETTYTCNNCLGKKKK